MPTVAYAAQSRDLIRSWKDSASGSASRPSADSLSGPVAARPSTYLSSAGSLGPEMSDQSSQRGTCATLRHGCFSAL